LLLTAHGQPAPAGFLFIGTHQLSLTAPLGTALNITVDVYVKLTP
jgi:hypothetical protein